MKTGLVLSRSSSKYNLCADFGLGLFQSVQWLFFCWRNNRYPMQNVDKRISLSQFRVIDSSVFSKINLQSSPSRALCDIFWNTTNWNMIYHELKNGLSVLEVGCGSGNYGLKFYELLGDKLSHYSGVDVVSKEEWKNFAGIDKLSFSVGDASLVSQHLKGVNFIFTQSALEHFPEDLTFFSQISDYVKNCTYPVMQIHLMPSSACLTTYLLHGYRHYTPRSVSSITNLFDNNSTFELFQLGSKKCNKLHRNFITYPRFFFRKDLRKVLFKIYSTKMINSILSDSRNAKDVSPSFYALIIKSNFK